MVNEFRKNGAKTEKRGENGKKGLIGRFSEKSEKSAGFGKEGFCKLFLGACRVSFLQTSRHGVCFDGQGWERGHFQMGEGLVTLTVIERVLRVGISAPIFFEAKFLTVMPFQRTCKGFKGSGLPMPSNGESINYLHNSSNSANDTLIPFPFFKSFSPCLIMATKSGL